MGWIEMPDICMCLDEFCPMKDNCLRYISEASMRQSYFMDSPRDEGASTCDYYISVEGLNFRRRRKDVSKPIEDLI